MGKKGDVKISSLGPDQEGSLEKARWKMVRHPHPTYISVAEDLRALSY